MPTPPAPAWISTVSPACRWPNSNRQSSAVPNATGTHATAMMSAPSGTGHVTIAGTDVELGVRAPEVRRDDALADVTIGHAVADLADRARALVADDVRNGRHLAARAVERVAALDADRLDLDDARRRRRPPDRRRPRSGTRRADRSRSKRRPSWPGCYVDTSGDRFRAGFGGLARAGPRALHRSFARQCRLGSGRCRWTT